jgi:hydroxymethylbilane synthase
MFGKPMTNRSRFRIGTRGSPLARAQTELVRARLAAVHRLDPEVLEVVIIKTSGDAVRDRPLAEVGGKGLFTKEIEEALLAGTVDVALHSAKDVPTFLPQGLTLAAFPERADPRDVFVGGRCDRLADLPAGSVVGTASVRREALVRRLRPDVEVRLLRGNVHTRLEKVSNGSFDAAVMALAGLQRLGLAGRAKEILDPRTFPPPVGQGAIAVEIRANDESAAALVAAIDDVATSTALTAERAFLAELDGSCRTPIAGHAWLAGGRLYFYGLLISPDGREAVETRREGLPADAARLGADAGSELKRRAPASVLAAMT